MDDDYLYTLSCQFAQEEPTLRFRGHDDCSREKTVATHFDRDDRLVGIVKHHIWVYRHQEARMDLVNLSGQVVTQLGHVPSTPSLVSYMTSKHLYLANTRGIWKYSFSA